MERIAQKPQICRVAYPQVHDAVQIYHCRTCDGLTDLSENLPDFQIDEDYHAWKAMLNVSNPDQDKTAKAPCPRN
jgi:hypothetical protein